MTELPRGDEPDEESRDRRPTSAALGVCAVFYVAIYGGISLRQDIVAYGDIPCDQRAVIGAMEFRKLGFRELAFTQIEDGGPEVGLDGYYYSRHPSGGVVLLALAQMAGLTLPQARAIPLFFTTIGLFGLFLFFREATGRPWLAVIGTAFYASLSPVWLLADSYQFYSYALFVKGLAFWLIAAGTRRAGAARHKRFAMLALLLVLAVTALGLETIPAISLMAVFFPLFLTEGPTRGRVRVAFQAGSWVSAGIAVGVGLHILNVAAIGQAGLGLILQNYFLALRGRSLDQAVWMPLDFPYPVEILRRCATYMPQVVVAVGIAVVWRGLRWLAGARPIRVPAWRILLACLLSEGLYFVVMQGHVREHAHTTVHLGVVMATLGTVSVAMITEGLSWGLRDAVLAGLTIGALLVAAVVAPLQSLGNLVAPFPDDHVLRVEDAAIDGLARRLPRDAVVAVASESYQQWPLGYVLARQDLTMVGVCPDRWSRPPSLILALAERIARPYFVLTSPGGPVEARRTMRRRAPLVAESNGYRLYAVKNYDPAIISSFAASLSLELIGAARLVSPAAEALERASIKYGLFGNAGRGVWMHAPPRPVGGPTVVRIEIPEDDRPDGVREVIVTFRYDRHPTMRQPSVTAALRIWTEEDDPTGPGRASPLATLTPGQTGDCRVELPKPGVLAQVDLALDLAPNEADNVSAAVVVPEVRYVRR